ncbi:hypothetical protein JW899_02220 [Candidatus Uhrbacteria bacterium]|nr:hypothetical protein [Candidatus Uhrbacteria bacterium]
MGKRQEQVFHEMIWDYYQTEYPKMLKERFEERLTDALDDKTREKYSSMLNRLGVARLAPPLFSAPRRRDGFGDTIGIMAYSYMYTPEETIPHKGEFMFFFSKKDGVFSLDKVYLLGEDPGRFETSPWDRMNRENVN